MEGNGLYSRTTASIWSLTGAHQTCTFGWSLPMAPLSHFSNCYVPNQCNTATSVCFSVVFCFVLFCLVFVFFCFVLLFCFVFRSGLPTACGCQFTQLRAFLFGLENLTRSSARVTSAWWFVVESTQGCPQTRAPHDGLSIQTNSCLLGCWLRNNPRVAILATFK